MNRRSFLKRFSSGVAAAIALANIPALLAQDAPTRLFDGPILFKGHKVVFDQYCPNNTIYFVNPRYMRAWDTRTGQRVA